MKHIFLLAVAPVAALVLPGAAVACGAESGVSFVHRALPTPLPEGAIVAEVQFPEERTTEFFRVQVLRMVQGEPAPTLQLVSLRRSTSCDEFIEPGTRGYVIGTLIGLDAGAPVIDPIRVSRRSGYRLPDGSRLLPPSRIEIED